MALTYTEAEAALTNAGGDIIQASQVFASAKTNIVAADNKLGNIPTTYAELVATVDANQADPAWAALKLRMDKIVADYLTAKAGTAGARTALEL